MSLKDLCSKYKKYNQDMIQSCNLLSEYFHHKKDESFEELDSDDLDGLRPYLLCNVLAIYEYLCIKSGVTVGEWFSKYSGIVCPMEDNDFYLICLRNPLNENCAEGIYKSSLECSIEPFKSRGSCSKVFNFSV